MRPIKLTMSAFGSYSDAETIDFTKFHDKSIFLITGPTGAGKTTIFDGICYALYGHTSSSDKDENYIRNDISDLDILTYVELDFELRNKRYHIRRSPKQLRKKLRGDGFTEQPAEAELKLVDDEKIITGVTEVNEKVVELIGLEYEQFRQIIMIPQGEFRQLITAKSREREEILRKIFGTYEYRKIQEALEKMAKEVRIEISKLEEGLKTNIQNISAGENEELKTIIAKDAINLDDINTNLKSQIELDKNGIEELGKKIDKLDGEIVNINNKIIKGKHINESLQKKIAIEKEKSDLEARKEEIDNLENLLEKGKKALGIKVIEDNYISSKNRLESKEKEIEELSKKITIAENSLEIAEKQLKNKLEQRKELNKIKEDIGLYNSYIDKVKKYEEKKGEKEELTKEYNEHKTNLENKEREIVSIKNKIKELNERKEELKNCESEYGKLEVQLDKNEDINNKMISLIPQIEQLQKLRAEYRKEKIEYNSLSEEYKRRKADVENIRKKIIDGYAGKLANELENGKPCSVCGSIHHPDPAKSIDGVPTEEELKIAEKKLEKLDTKCRKSKEKLIELESEGKAKNNLIEEKKNEIGIALKEDISELKENELIDFITNSSKKMIKQISEDKARLERLKKEIDEANKINKEILELDKKKEEEEKNKELLYKAYTQSFGKLESITDLVHDLEKELPESIRSEKKLKAKIDELLENVKKIEESIEKAQNEMLKCRDELNSLSSAKDERIKALDELKKECMDLYKKFNTQISLQGFNDEEEYRNAKLTDEEINSIDENIRNYKEEMKSVNDRYVQILKETKDMKPVDIHELENELNLKKEEKSILSNNRDIVFSRLENNKKIYNSIKDIREKILVKEKEYATVGELSSAANGRNAHKMTFETYVLAAYFEDIIEAANIRFRKMTKNRFQMERVEEGTGNAYRGLDIEILDGNSGQSRPIKNISGGESFKASLSLALGLADVVQAYAGGIKLDTMFIDEGFGSLDSSSLDDAINCLLELQSSGRLVGIISHVKELQERIQTRIEVEPNVDGSKVKCIV